MGKISQKSNENFVAGYTFNLCKPYFYCNIEPEYQKSEINVAQNRGEKT